MIKSTSPMKVLMSSIRKRRTKLNGSTPSASKIKSSNHQNTAVKEFSIEGNLPASEDHMMMCVDSEEEQAEDESGLTEAEENLYEIRFELPYHFKESEEQKDIVVQ